MEDLVPHCVGLVDDIFEIVASEGQKVYSQHPIILSRDDGRPVIQRCIDKFLDSRASNIKELAQSVSGVV